MKLTPHEKHILKLVRENPEIVTDPEARRRMAEQIGLTEKTLRNRIGDLKKYGLLEPVTTDVPGTPAPQPLLPDSALSSPGRIVREADGLSPLFRLLRTIWTNKIGLILYNAAGILITAGILLMLPNWYKSTATFVINEEKDVSDLTGAILGNLPIGFGLGTGGIADRYLGFLGSRTVLDAMIDSFDLMVEYETEFRSEAYQTLLENCTFTDNENNSISITCYGKENPAKAAAMANYFYTLLYDVTLRVNNSQALLFREMIERNYGLSVEQLHNFEEEFRHFQEQTKLYNLENQTQMSLEAISNLEIEKIQLQLRRDFLSQTVPDDRPEIHDIDIQLRLLDTKIKDLKTKQQYSNLPTENIPQEGLTYLRLFRNVMIQEKITEFLALQLEQARISERKKVANLVLLDQAVPADKKSKPHRANYLIMITVLNGLFSLILFRIKDYIRENETILTRVFRP